MTFKIGTCLYQSFSCIQRNDSPLQSFYQLLGPRKWYAKHSYYPDDAKQNAEANITKTFAHHLRALSAVVCLFWTQLMEAPEVSAGGAGVSTSGNCNLICRTLTGVARKVGPEFSEWYSYSCLAPQLKFTPTNYQETAAEKFLPQILPLFSRLRENSSKCYFFHIFTCCEAISDKRGRSTSRIFPPPPPIIKFWHIMPIFGCMRGALQFPGKV